MNDLIEKEGQTINNIEDQSNENYLETSEVVSQSAQVESSLSDEGGESLVEDNTSEMTDTVKEEISSQSHESESELTENVPKQDEESLKEEKADQFSENELSEQKAEESISSDLNLSVAKGEPKWYIVQTLTGQEDKVKMRIEQTVEELNLKDKILRVLVPEEETIEIRGEKRFERKRKMYPGYVFIEMILDEETWYKIRSTAGVARFIGSKTSPVPVTDREMQRVLKQLGIKEKEINVEFSIGEPIRIISGSFRGYTGSVAEINPAKSKLKALINIFGRDTSVEVDFDRVEKVI